MSILDEVFLEEYDRAIRIIRAIENEQISLPKGSIQLKIIHGVKCYYLQYRDGKKIKSKYIKNDELEEIRLKVSRRNENKIRLSELRENVKKLEKVLGKEIINEHTTNGIS